MKSTTIEFDEKKGEAFFLKGPVEILTRGQLAAVERAFVKADKENAEKIIFESVKNFTKETVQNTNMFLMGIIKLRKKEVAELLLTQLPQRGFGTGKITEWNENTGNIKIEIKNSFESFNTKSAKPSCHAMKGIIAGAYEILFGEECNCTESQCSATGKESCVFECKKK